MRAISDFEKFKSTKDEDDSNAGFNVNIPRRNFNTKPKYEKYNTRNNKLPQQNKREDKCYNCGKLGHHAFECQSKSKNTFGNKGAEDREPY